MGQGAGCWTAPVPDSPSVGEEGGGKELHKEQLDKSDKPCRDLVWLILLGERDCTENFPERVMFGVWWGRGRIPSVCGRMSLRGQHEACREAGESRGTLVWLLTVAGVRERVWEVLNQSSGPLNVHHAWGVHLKTHKKINHIKYIS